MKNTIFLILAALVVAFTAEDVVACSCTEPSQLDTFKEAKVVVVGRFLETNSDYEHKFKVIKAWKGAKKGQTVWINIFDLSGCNYDFDLVKGKEFLLYALPNNGSPLFPNSKLPIVYDCNRSYEIKDAADDIKKMRSTVIESRK